MLGLQVDVPSISAGPFVFSKKAAPQKSREYRGRFDKFIRRANPKLQFYSHVDLLVDTLQRVADGEIKRLMVFEPPRHGKSEIVSRLFPAYYVRRHPDRFVGLTSYGADLAYTLSRNARENYTITGGVLNDAAGAIKQWETQDGGGMWAAGVGGSQTGKGYSLGIIDDPVRNEQDAGSQTIRERHKDWYGSTFYTRGEPGAAIVIVQTRWHEDDLSGWLLNVKEKEDPEHWHVLIMDAIRGDTPIEIPSTCTRIDGDHRAPGDALCPERYPLPALERIQRTLGDFAWSALYQQQPTSAEGDVFKTSWWDVDAGRNRFSLDDAALSGSLVGRWIHVDTAIKDGQSNDYTAAVVTELTPDYRLLVRSLWRDKVHSAELPKHIEDLAVRWNHDGRLRGIIIEDKASGPTVIGTLRRSSPEWIAALVQEFQPIGTKEERGRQASIWCWRDCVWLPDAHRDADWLHDFADPSDGELFKFPHGAHDDQVDAFVMAIIHAENLLSAGWQGRNRQDEAGRPQMTPEERQRARLAARG